MSGLPTNVTRTVNALSGFLLGMFLSDPEQQVEAEEDDKDPKPTSTPPSTPVRAEEGMLAWRH